MQEFEKLGMFYLGKEYDVDQKEVKEDLVLLKSKDLTTHAVIIGMTGSGKTGLGIGMMEEAMIDQIPVIAIDPKGDLGNLALTFPGLKKEEFQPWINLQDATTKGMSPDEYATNQSELWRNGLAEWGQDVSRVEALHQAADVKIYTPGGTAGIGVSVLKSFQAPSKEIRDDQEVYKDRISATTISLLSLIGIQADSVTSREYILLSNIFENTWNQGNSISLEELILSIQKPQMEKVGVLDLESFYPSKERMTLAILLNNLLASPGFEAWLEGVPLDINRFFYDDAGKPQASVFSIAHLSDSERMFFVTMLLNEIIAWMRQQPGTGSLRAILYMDELFGYLPPTANPPSKGPLLTLLKQARAYGLGLVLSTQNPVDLDYKALSNAGTWFIGRLQTERDKERVLAGLEGAAAGGAFDKARTEQILAGIGQRVFYLHSVHEDNPVIFTTRWVLSYLAGPLTKDQIRLLAKKDKGEKGVENKIELGVNTGEQRNLELEGIDKSIEVEDINVKKNSNAVEESNSRQADVRQDILEQVPFMPVLSPQIKQVYLPVAQKANEEVVYQPAIIGAVDVLYQSTKHNVSISQSYTILTPLREGPISIDWNESQLLEIDMNELDANPVDSASHSAYPQAAEEVKNYENWKKLLVQYIRTNISLKLFYSPELKTVSEHEEGEREFKIRLAHLAHEKRDDELDKMKAKYASRIQTLEDRQLRAEQAVEKQNTKSSQKKMEAFVSAGSAILGALLGRKRISSTSVSKIGTAVKSTSRALKSGEGIEQAKETLETVNDQLVKINEELEQQLEEIASHYEMIKESLEEVEIRATSQNITVHLVGLAWNPQ